MTIRLKEVGAVGVCPLVFLCLKVRLNVSWRWESRLGQDEPTRR